MVLYEDAHLFNLKCKASTPSLDNRVEDILCNTALIVRYYTTIVKEYINQPNKIQGKLNG